MIELRVRFINPGGEDRKMLQGADSLKEGREYVVLEIFIPAGKSPLFRVEFISGEDSALFDSRLFTVTSSEIPSTWNYFQLESGSVSLCPETWNRVGFWEDFYDRDRGACETYEAEKGKILAQSAPPTAARK
ncbi:hypothetical protein ACIBL6_43270 [Streptomyces sp. NPDC050400]|uniref:hypothetical protein n=1 Tax=Streptomyces sp. NPDC050400 TaxID=3365610 RepID=UPI00378A4CC6